MPVDGVVTYGTVRMHTDVRDQLITDLEKEADALVEQALKANPDIYYQWPDGDWSLREYRLRWAQQKATQAIAPL